MCKKNVQTGCTGYLHSSNTNGRKIINNLLIIKWSHVDVMRPSLSLGAWWPGGRSSSWVSQFLPSGYGSAYQMVAKWRDGYQGGSSPWWFWHLCFCSVWGRCPTGRGEQTLRYAQLSAQLSARLYSPDWSCFHTTLKYTESVHFLWSLNKKFSGLLVRPWISSAVADGTAFAWLS